jgi:hypothetical protein
MSGVQNISVREYRRDNQKRKIQKHTIYGTQDEEKQNKNTKQYVLDTTLRKQTQIYIYHSTKRITYMHRNENNKHMDTKKTPSSVKPGYLEKTTDLSQVTDKRFHQESLCSKL